MEKKILYGNELVPQEAQLLSQTWYGYMSLMRYITQWELVYLITLFILET